MSPECDRISPERLRGLLWRRAGEARIASTRARKNSVVRKMVTVIRVDQSDWYREQFGSFVA